MSQCPIHDVEFKTIPAGVSKATGKAYNSFQACPERGCREKPQGGSPVASPAPVSPVAGPLLLQEMQKQTKLLAMIVEKLTPKVVAEQEIPLDMIPF